MPCEYRVEAFIAKDGKNIVVQRQLRISEGKYSVVDRYNTPTMDYLPFGKTWLNTCIRTEMTEEEAAWFNSKKTPEEREQNLMTNEIIRSEAYGSEDAAATVTYPDERGDVVDRDFGTYNSRQFCPNIPDLCTHTPQCRYTAVEDFHREVANISRAEREAHQVTKVIPSPVSDMIPAPATDLELTGTCEVCKTAISNTGTHAMTMSGECPVTGELLREAIRKATLGLESTSNISDYEMEDAAEYLNQKLIRRG